MEKNTFDVPKTDLNGIHVNGIDFIMDEEPSVEDILKKQEEKSAKNAEKQAQREEEKQEIGGYEPLGYDGKHSVVWSVGRESIVHISPSDITSHGTLMSICGAQWIEDQDRYGIFKEDPDSGATFKVGVNYKKLSGEIIDACTRKGGYSESALRGAGVWPSDDEDGVLIVNSRKVFRTDGKLIGRLAMDYIYEQKLDLKVTPESAAATVADVKSLLKTLKTWRYKRKSDVYLMLGWALSGFLTGALAWRTHTSLTGKPGTGKSALIRLLKRIFGNACIKSDGDSSVAGVRQKMGTNALVYIGDENEPENDNDKLNQGKKLAELLRFFRSASSGAEILRGTADQKGRSYTARFTGLAAGTERPLLNPADASRLLLVELSALPIGGDSKEPLLAAEENSVAANKLGAQLSEKLFARMLKDWVRSQRVVDTVKDAMRKAGFSNRLADTLGGPIAFAWLGLHDGELSERNAVRWVKAFDLSESKELVANTDSANDMIQYITAQSVTFHNRPMMLSQLAQLAVFESGRKLDAINTLAQYGIRVERIASSTCIGMTMWLSSPKLKEVMKLSKWASSDPSHLLMQIPGSHKNTKTVRIGNAPKSGTIFIPTDITINLEEDEIDFGISAETATVCANVSNINM